MNSQQTTSSNYKRETVNRHTRAGQNGKIMLCPKCGTAMRVYHFSFCGITCQGCREGIDKYELELPSSDELANSNYDLDIPISKKSEGGACGCPLCR